MLANRERSGKVDRNLDRSIDKKEAARVTAQANRLNRMESDNKHACISCVYCFDKNPRPFLSNNSWKLPRRFHKSIHLTLFTDRRPPNSICPSTVPRISFMTIGYWCTFCVTSIRRCSLDKRTKTFDVVTTRFPERLQF